MDFVKNVSNALSFQPKFIKKLGEGEGEVMYLVEIDGKSMLCRTGASSK